MLEASLPARTENLAGDRWQPYKSPSALAMGLIRAQRVLDHGPVSCGPKLMAARNPRPL